MKNKLVTNRELIIVASLALLGVVLGSFYDFDISKNFYSVNLANSIGAGIGTVISNLIASVAAVLLIVNHPKDKTLRVLSTIGSVLVFGGSLYGDIDNFLDTQKYTPIPGGQPTMIIFLVFIVVSHLLAIPLALFALKKLDKKALLLFSTVVFFVFGIYFLSNEAIKFLSSRPRPMTVLNIVQDDAIFRNWWEFWPFDCLKESSMGLYKSFPSAHSQNVGTLLLSVPALTLIFPKLSNKKWRYILFYISLAYALLIMLSRVHCRAHYLSDVSFALFLDTIIIYVEQQLILKYYKKEEISDEQ